MEKLPWSKVWSTLTKEDEKSGSELYWKEQYINIQGEINEILNKTKPLLDNFNKKIKKKDIPKKLRIKHRHIFWYLLRKFYGKITDFHQRLFEEDQLPENAFNYMFNSKYHPFEFVFKLFTSTDKRKANIILAAMMGTGKTFTINHICRILKQSAISITCRCSLATNQYGEFNRKCNESEIKMIENKKK